MIYSFIHRQLFRLVSYLNRLEVKNPDYEPNRIYTIDQLRLAAVNKRSVVVWCAGQGTTFYYSAPKPAAFILNYNASCLDYAIRNGVYLYSKPQPCPF